MDLAKITSKGQITIPRDVREKIKLKTGDKILFFEENGKFFLQFFLQNSNAAALMNFQNEMKVAADEAGFKSPDDVSNYIKELRKSTKK